MKVLICEDEPNVAKFIEKALQEEDFETSTVYDGQLCLDMLRTFVFDVILLDVVMPVKNGWEVCREIRESLKLDTPIIMLTALNSTSNVVKGLQHGADDYVAKPFEIDELVARIQAVTRRHKADKPNFSAFKFADIEMDDERKEVKRNGTFIHLTAKEYELLKFFLKNPNKMLNRNRILQNVWGIDFEVRTNVVDVYINYLRNKLEEHNAPRLIQTVTGMGYILKEPENETAA